MLHSSTNDASIADDAIAEASEREMVSRLLVRYPELSRAEEAKLVKLYRELAPVDVALLLSDDALQTQLDQFSADYRNELKTPFRQYAVLVGIAILGFALFLWAFLNPS